MNSIEMCIKQFDNHILEAHNNIGSVICQISKADENIKLIVDEFRREMNAIELDYNNLFEKELSGILELHKDNCNKWCDTIESFISGKEFIDQFEKSILVVVFGNVNVGKSSIGNLIAGVVDKNTEKPELYDLDMSALRKYFGEIPAFYEYDISDGSKKAGARKKPDSLFNEGYIETTATIQYFTRNEGLTWTDSPGICSVNQNNGDLAKKYVEFADLVIFITSSSSPAKDDEVKELKQLFSKRKPVLIVVNKSDVVEKDEINGKIVRTLKPKSDDDRRKQELYIKNSFERVVGEIITDVNAISVSRSLALEALREDDEDKFVASGFKLFFNILGSIFDENAVDLKMSAPKNRVNAVINEIINGGRVGEYNIIGVKQYQNDIIQLNNKISAVKEKLLAVPDMAVPTIIKETMNYATYLIQNESLRVRMGKESTDISNQISGKMTEIVCKELNLKVKDILEDFSNDMIHPLENLNFEEIKVDPKIETVTRTEYDVKTVKRNPSGLIEHIEACLFDKEFTRSKVVSRTVEESFINGDNSNEILSKMSSSIESAAKTLSKEYIDIVILDYFSQEEIVLEQMEKKLIYFEEAMRGELIR